MKTYQPVPFPPQVTAALAISGQTALATVRSIFGDRCKVRTLGGLRAALKRGTLYVIPPVATQGSLKERAFFAQLVGQEIQRSAVSLPRSLRDRITVRHTGDAFVLKADATKLPRAARRLTVRFRRYPVPPEFLLFTSRVNKDGRVSLTPSLSPRFWDREKVIGPSLRWLQRQFAVYDGNVSERHALLWKDDTGARPTWRKQFHPAFTPGDVLGEAMQAFLYILRQGKVEGDGRALFFGIVRNTFLARIRDNKRSPFVGYEDGEAELTLQSAVNSDAVLDDIPFPHYSQGYDSITRKGSPGPMPAGKKLSIERFIKVRTEPSIHESWYQAYYSELVKRAKEMPLTMARVRREQGK